MEQAAHNIDHNMTDRIIEEEEVKHEEEEPKQLKTRTKAKPKAKPKTQHDTETKLTKAEMEELADINT